MVTMARVGRSAWWRPVGAAVTFLLAAVAGVAGNQLTGRVDAALGVFAALAVAGMMLTYVLDRQAAGRADANDRGRAADRTRLVDLRDARGVQVGDGNVQRNYFGRGPGPGSGG
jgi:hypothetical protein